MIVPDLKAIPKGAGWNGSIHVAKLMEKGGAPAIEFDKEDFNIIWLDGFEFNNGTIEFDVKGKSAPPQGSFIGAAFRVADEVTYDAVYFRPFNFGASEPERRSHAVQYISHPYWTWFRLREEKPGEFEKPIEPVINGDAWFHSRIKIENRQIKVFVNTTNQPVLQVTELSKRTGGSIGLWCFGYGAIANLRIMPE